jgi:predicted Zn-dependent protease
MGANGLWIEDGEIVGPVGGVTIATTLDGFLQTVVQVGSDLRFMPMFGAIGVPTLRVDNVIIGGQQREQGGVWRHQTPLHQQADYG